MALITLATQLAGVPNKISMEGHTDSRPLDRNGGEYSNWELSVDRANNVRRLMQDHGLRSDQVSEVRGYADQKLRKPEAPLDPSNRRISVIVQYLKAPQPKWRNPRVPPQRRKHLRPRRHRNTEADEAALVSLRLSVSAANTIAWKTSKPLSCDKSGPVAK